MIKLFSHRGLVSQGIKQNSIASLNNAYKSGFRAIEFDIWFLNNKLLLKHDKPKDGEILPEFKEFLLYKNDLQYWLDFKNLDGSNAKSALLEVKKHLNANQINMEKVYFAPFITDYIAAIEIFNIIRDVFGDVKIMAVCEKLEHENDLILLSKFLIQNQIKHLSIFHQLLNQRVCDILLGIEIFAWTVNDKNRFEELKKLGIKNFATDIIL